MRNLAQNPQDNDNLPDHSLTEGVSVSPLHLDRPLKIVLIMPKAMYSWGTIINRLIYCRMRIINLVTSLVVRWNLKEQIRSLKKGKNLPLRQQSISATS